VKVLEREGWEQEWANGASASHSLPGGGAPDLVLFDPEVITPQGLASIASLRLRKPGLAAVVLGQAGQFEDVLRQAGLEPRAVPHLDRNLPVEAWPATLRACLGGFGPRAEKFTAEDLFGDILEEIMAPAVVAGRVPASAYTLKDLPGIQDPFGPSAEPGPAAVPREPVFAPLPEVDTNPLPEADTDPSLAAVPKPEPGPMAVAPEPPADYSLEEFGNYYLLEKIAVGGMAELFKARQRGVHNFEKIVAIKRILPHLSDNDDFVRMFIDEAKLAAQLTHPNIAQIFDLGKAGGFYYIAMEFVDGRDLRSLLRKVREYKLPLPEQVAAAVTMKVANALDYAHRERGINDKELKLVHRDISPQNILISYDGAVKLVDFGIAKAATKSTQTMAGALKGKLLYMSPEQALGQNLDGRSDLYSLGLVLFELLTGERCFQADSELGVLEKVRMGKVQEVRAVNPDVSPEMAAILDKALQRNVDQRYASARMLERDLRALMVKNANEPTEHEVAAYVNTLLKGTREELVALLETQFPRPVAPQAPSTADSFPMPGEGPAEVEFLRGQPGASPAPLVTVCPTPKGPGSPAPKGAREGGRRPVWFLPLMAGLTLTVILVVWLLMHR
jgi:hypothetical protein